MRASLAIFAIILFADSARCADADRKPLDEQFLRFDTVAGDDRIPVLRMHFHLDGKEYDATYCWQSDPDNYPRFTGYLYLSGTKSPGLEALFSIHK
jgi:hypothetical protein